MATLEKIRNKAGLLVTVVGVALFAFILGDGLRSGSTFFQQSKEKVANVNGEAIHVQDYQQRVDQLSEMVKRGGSLTEAQQQQIRENIFNQMVNSILIKNIGDKTGLTVGKEELADMTMGNNISPIFTQSGDFINPNTRQFDKNMLLQFIQTVETDDLSMYPADIRDQLVSMQQNWEYMKQSAKEQRLYSKLSTIIAFGMVANSLDAQASFEETAVESDFNYVSQLYTSIPDSAVTVTDAEISKLYNETKEGYKQEKAKLIDFISVEITPSQADFQDVKERMESIRTELAETSNVADVVNYNSDVQFADIFITAKEMQPEAAHFTTTAAIGDIDGPVMINNTYYLRKLIDVKSAPDSAFVYLLSLPQYAKEDELKQLTDSLIGVLKTKTFAEMADEATGGKGNGEMGWQTEKKLYDNGMDAQLIADIFNAKVNEPVILKSSMGSHLIQVTEKTKPVSKFKLAEVSVAVTPSSETYNQLYNDLNQYIAKNKTVKEFRAGATEAGYFCQNDFPVAENQGGLYMIENSRQVIRWAFSNKTGSVSDIFECQNYFVAAAVSGEKHEGYTPQSEVSAQLKQELIRKKKGEQIVTNLKSKNLSTLDQYAAAMNSDIRSANFVSFKTPNISGGIGHEPAVNARLATTEVGKVTGVFAGNRAAYVLEITNKKEVKDPYDEKTVKENIQNETNNRIPWEIQYGTMLRDGAKIEDNRSRFY